MSVQSGAFELGMFEEFWRRKGQTETGAFRDAFAQIDAGERWTERLRRSGPAAGESG